MTVLGGEAGPIDPGRILDTGLRSHGRFHSISQGSSFKSLASALCLVILLTPSVLGAATWCTIEVEVTDGGAEALEGVDLAAEASVLFDARRQVTGPNGIAVLLGLPPGSYRMEISREGYQWMEIQDVRCEPASVVRLMVKLEKTEGEEIVMLPSGPSVNPEATNVGDIRSRTAWELLPSGDVNIADPVGFQPADAIAFAGILQAGHGGGPGSQVVVAHPYPGKGLHGRASIETGGGLRARPTGTRGDVTSLDDGLRTRFSIGGIPGDSRLGAFFALEIDAARLDGRVEIGDDASSESVRNRRQWDQGAVLAFGDLDWMPTPDNRVTLRLNWGRRQNKELASSLYVASDGPLPGGERDHLGRALRLEWDRLASDVFAVRLAGGYSDDYLQWMPTNPGLMEQDQSPEGDWTAGLGNGVWAGDGGVAAFDRGVEDLHGEAGLEWVAGSGHRLGVEASWHREDLDLRYSREGDGAGLGFRRTHRGPVAERMDNLLPPDVSLGLLESWRILLQDAWRAAPGLTVVLGLEAADIRFDPGGTRPGYRFGADDTLSPRVGIVWDFEGTGRSRAWARWARFRQGPGEAVRWRLTGALDIETVFINDDGSEWERSPGAIEVAADLTPAVADETVLGVEYEVLSHLVVGAAASFRRSRGGLAFLTEDGGQTLALDTPSGDLWPERLDSEAFDSWGWVRKRLANGWQADILIGWHRSRGAWPGEPRIDLADLDREYLADVLSPQALENAWGPLPDDRRWHLEMSGSWLFAAGPSLGGRLTYRSGAPMSRLGALADGLGLDRRFIGSRGSAGRTAELWNLDVIGSWPFRVGAGELEAFVDLSNLLNRQRAASSDERWTVLDEVQSAGLNPDEQRTEGTWGQPLVVQSPLELRVGLTYRW